MIKRQVGILVSQEVPVMPSKLQIQTTLCSNHLLLAFLVLVGVVQEIILWAMELALQSGISL